MRRPPPWGRCPPRSATGSPGSTTGTSGPLSTAAGEPRRRGLGEQLAQAGVPQVATLTAPDGGPVRAHPSLGVHVEGAQQQGGGGVGEDDAGDHRVLLV